MSISQMLRGHDVFRALTLEEVNSINQFSRVTNVRQDEYVFRCGRPASHVFLLLEGKVFLRLPGERPECTINAARVKKGELFGVSPLLGSTSYTTSPETSAT